MTSNIGGILFANKPGNKGIAWVSFRPSSYYIRPVSASAAGPLPAYGYLTNYERPRPIQYAGAPGFGGILFG